MPRLDKLIHSNHVRVDIVKDTGAGYKKIASEFVAWDEPNNILEWKGSKYIVMPECLTWENRYLYIPFTSIAWLTVGNYPTVTVEAGDSRPLTFRKSGQRIPAVAFGQTIVEEKIKNFMSMKREKQMFKMIKTMAYVLLGCVICLSVTTILVGNPNIINSIFGKPATSTGGGTQVAGRIILLIKSLVMHHG